MKNFLLLAAFIILGACTPKTEIESGRFDSKSTIVNKFDDLQQFRIFANPTERDAQVKFVLYNFQEPQLKNIDFLNPANFNFHDDWYLLKTYNGQAVPASSDQPAANLGISSPLDLQKYLLTLNPLPAGLSNSGGRIISKKFYDKAIGSSKIYGLGSVIHSIREGREEVEILAFDLAFSDSPSEAELTQIYNLISKSLNADNLKWLPRSEAQEKLATELSQKSFWKGKITDIKKFRVPGEFQLYSGEVAAGKIRYFKKGEYRAALTKADEILILEELPDDLPLVRGVITNVPQSSLSHVSLLSRGRGTLSAYTADGSLFEVLKSKSLDGKPYVIGLKSEKMLIQELSTEIYNNYLSLIQPQPYKLPSTQFGTEDYVVKLEVAKSWSDEKVIRTLGGKNFGMTKIMKSGIKHPMSPFGISIKAYREHFDKKAKDFAQKMILDSRFSDPRVQLLALEGAKEFEAQFPGELQKDPAKTLLSAADTSSLGQLVKEGGLKNVIEKTEIDPKLEEKIKGHILENFQKIPVGQAFRFRSSSDLEDIPGFSAAGLYDSYSGCLDPSLQTESEKKKTISRAIKKTWASYWNYRAFRERQEQALDHFSGGMGVMVHPNFPTTAELANGVATIHWDSQVSDVLSAEISVHFGETSVVRPDGSLALPQIIQANEKDGVVEIKKNSPSSDGAFILTAEESKDLTLQMKKVLKSWVSEMNLNLSSAQRFTGYALDIEFKVVPEGWLSDFSANGKPIILIKQARPMTKFDRKNLKFSEMPIPRNLLGEATKILKRTFSRQNFKFETVEVYRAQTPYDGAFNAYVSLLWKKAVGPFLKNSKTFLDHTQFQTSHPFMHHGPWDLNLDVKQEHIGASKLKLLYSGAWGEFRLTDSLGSDFDLSGDPVDTEVLIQEPESYLKEIFLGSAPPEPGGGGGEATQE